MRDYSGKCQYMKEWKQAQWTRKADVEPTTTSRERWVTLTGEETITGQDFKYRLLVWLILKYYYIIKTNVGLIFIHLHNSKLKDGTYVINPDEYQSIGGQYIHSHKTRKDSLEGSLIRYYLRLNLSSRRY